MNAKPSEASPRRPSRLAQFTIASAPALFIGLLGAGCSSGHPTPVTSGAQAGTILAHPDTSIGSNTFVVDPNGGGQLDGLQITQLAWGRLANVRDLHGDLQNTDMVIGEDIRSDGIDFDLIVNPITEETTVKILHIADTPAYVQAFERLELGLTSAIDKSLDPSELPPFTLVPRNAALLVQFNDLLDSTTIHQVNLRMVVGYPAASPFDYRLVMDRNHGDLFDADGDGVQEFHTTRVIIDTTVSSVEASTTNPPLPINNLGLPGSINQSQANTGLRIPTVRDSAVGQTTILTNLAGKGLSFGNNGSNDASVSTHDIVRALRSGGGAAGAATDPNNGFLVDQIAPSIVGIQAVSISTPTGVPDDYVTTVDYALNFCAVKPKIGDVIQQPPGVFAEVTQANNNPSGGTVTEVHFRVVSPLNGTLSAGPAQFYTLWDPVENFGKQACFVQYSPVPASSTPGQGVSSDAHVRVRFSEPMDPTTLTAFDNMPVLRVDPANGPPTARDFVIGDVLASADLKEFTFQPVLNFKHTLGSSADTYWINLASGASGPVDLSGNPITSALPAVLFTIDPNDATEQNGGLVFRFSTLDELNNDGKPEWRGQVAPDLNNGRMGPRPVGRLRATCDRTVPVPGQMLQFTAGLQTPLSSLGSKLQTLWRYCDVGFALLDESTYNVDVEHLYWAPAGGNVVGDTYDKFEIRLSHTKYLPDESLDPNVLPYYPLSGLTSVFTDNLLNTAEDPQRIVHPALRGYVVNPADKKPASTNAEQIMPFPLNQGVPVSQYNYYTWRDTAILSKGGAFTGGGLGAPGAELRIVCTIVYGGTNGCMSCPYGNSSSTNPPPSLALPLLMEYRCYPDSGALGLNALDVNFAINSSAQPNFRAYSTGGTNTAGNQVSVNPDTEAVAHGGFNPTSTPPGATTLSLDNTVYLGEMDLVLRISRMDSIWLDTLMLTPTYLPPVVEPRDADQPLGTSLQLHYRGATAITLGQNIATDATFIDPYGNATFCPQTPPLPCPTALCTTNGVPTFFGNPPFAGWRSSITDLNAGLHNAKLFQVRVTFVSNTDTNLSPTVSALGFAFRQ